MRIYFAGICGTAMGNAALLARELGHEVAGADQGVYPPMSEVLAAAGILVHEDFRPEAVIRWRPDVVVVGNVLSRGNALVEWLLDERLLPFVSLPAFLASSVLSQRASVVVSGTHGKTTTATLTAFLLQAAGKEPGWLIGGVPLDLPSGAAVGDVSGQSPFVIEGDEYDSAFFDKRSKFIHYFPRFLSVNNIEFDHADIFRDLVDIRRTFSHLVRLVPRSGCIVYNGDDPEVTPLVEVEWTRCLPVGTGAHCDLQIVHFTEDASGSRFDLLWRGNLWARVDWNSFGLYNARNAAVAALLAACASGHSEDPTRFSLQALSQFQGVRRRQQILLDTAELTVIEDFGHHPTAIEQTLESLRKRYSRRRLIACVEPRSNTARTNRLQRELIDALALADSVCVGPLGRPESVAADQRLDLDEVSRQLNVRGRTACAADDYAAVAAFARQYSKEQPAVICFFSNGSFGGVMQQFVAECAGQ